jgi:hypothetical protein
MTTKLLEVFVAVPNVLDGSVGFFDPSQAVLADQRLMFAFIPRNLTKFVKISNENKNEFQFNSRRRWRSIEFSRQSHHQS